MAAVRQLLVTGGTGFFGKSFLDYRRRHPEFLADAEITLLARHPERLEAECPELLRQPGLRLASGDVREFAYAALQRDFDLVVHAATSAVVTLSDAEQRSVIVEGTRRIVEFVRGGGAGKLLLTSSGAVYGPQTAPVAETAACRPVTAYGQGKLAAEALCAEAGVPAYLARCFAFVGPYLPRLIHYAIGNFIGDALAGRPLRLTGDGTPQRSYLEADDLVEWLAALVTKGTPLRPYNIGSEAGLSIRSVAEAVRDELAPALPVEVLATPVAGRPASVYVPKVERARAELGVAVKVPLRAAIRKAAEGGGR